MSVAKKLVILACVLAAAGWWVGLWPIQSEGADCGSAFEGPDELGSAVEADRVGSGLPAAGGCDDKRGDLQVVAFVLLGAGVLAGVGGWVAAGSGRHEGG